MKDALVASRRWCFALALSVLIGDQATKLAADAWLRGHDVVTAIPGFLSLTYSRNPGGLFGYFRDWPNPWRTLLLTLLPLVAIALIAGFLRRSRSADRPTLAGLALILGGATGNLIDRIARGEVIDFIDAHLSRGAAAEALVRWFGTAHWPTFNVADSSIVTGAGLLMLSVFRAQPGASSDPAGIERPSSGR